MKRLSIASALPLVACFAIWSQPIRLHPENPHYFLYGGKTVVLVTSGEHYGSVLNTGFDYRRYLETLQADGLNYTRVFGGSYREVPAKSFGIARNALAPAAGQYVAPWARSNTPGYRGGGNRFDLNRWDPAFFERFRDFLSEAARRGIIVEVTLFSSHYDQAQWEVSPMYPPNNVDETDAIDWKKLHTLENENILAHQERYTRKLVREANDFDNVIFEIQNEPWSDRTVLADVINPYLPLPGRNRHPNSVDLADEPSLAWQARVSEWIRSEEQKLPKKHLIAQNYCNFRFPVRGLVPGIDLVNFHYAYPGAVLENYGLGKPIAYDETGFLGRADDTYRREAWNFMLSGGSAFNNLDYSFTPGREDGTDTEPNGPGGGTPTLRRQLGVLKRFLDSLPLASMRPDATVVAHSGGAHAHAISAAGREYAIYLDGSGPVEIRLALPAGEYSGEWLNPSTGSVVKREGFRSGATTLQSPVFQNGIALHLRRSREK